MSALTCTDIKAMRAKLRALNLEFRENSPDEGRCQIFVKDPSDITLELYFRDA